MNHHVDDGKHLCIVSLQFREMSPTVDMTEIKDLLTETTDFMIIKGINAESSYTALKL